MNRDLSTDELNAIEGELQDRFEAEAEQMDDRFVEFVLSLDADDILRPIVMLLRGITPDATLAAEELRTRYVTVQLATRHIERADLEQRYREYGLEGA